MKNFKCFITSLFCLLTIGCFAQEVALKGGLDLRSTDYGLATGAKMNAEFKVAKNWSLAMNIGFNKNNSEEGNITNSSGYVYETAYNTTNVITEGRFYLKETFNGLYFNSRLGIRLINRQVTGTITSPDDTDLYYREYKDKAGIVGMGVGYSLLISEHFVIDIHTALNGDSWSDFPLVVDGGVCIGYKF